MRPRQRPDGRAAGDGGPGTLPPRAVLQPIGATPAMRNLLWVDCIAGALAGVAMLALSRWLGGLYALPRALLLFMGAANLLYATCSFTLARRSRRPGTLIHLLVAANLSWAVACLALAAAYAGSASMFGIGHLVFEGVFVGGLACLEWRWREHLLAAG